MSAVPSPASCSLPAPAQDAAARIVALMCQSIALVDSERVPEALACLDAGLHIDPGFLPCRMARVALLAGLMRFDEALADLNHVAARTQPAAVMAAVSADFAALVGLALAHVDARLAADAGDAQAYYLRGNVHWQTRDYGAALADYERALQLGAQDRAVQMARANALYQLDRFADAGAAYARLLEADGDDGLAWYNRGNALQKAGRLDEAIGSYRRAGVLLPDLAEAVLEQAHCRLALGALAAGWPLYEARWRTPQLRATQLASSQPRWLGQSAIEGLTVLLWAEQGFGDTIQFARFIPRVAERAARVVVRAPPALVGLLAAQDARIVVIGPDAPLPRHDVHTPLMSLPLALGVAADVDAAAAAELPMSAAYLRADAARARDWQAWLDAVPAPAQRSAHSPSRQPGRRPLVGLCWAGRTTGSPSGAAGAYNPGRDIPLAALACLSALDVQFVALQREYVAADDALLARLPNVLPVRTGLDDFAATAALVACLDLVITVDTAIAHLAGALGRPTWLLLRHAGEWRWQRARTDSPWYASMRLFRQRAEGDWETVVRDVAEALARRFDLAA